MISEQQNYVKNEIWEKSFRKKFETFFSTSSNCTWRISCPNFKSFRPLHHQSVCQISDMEFPDFSTTFSSFLRRPINIL